MTRDEFLISIGADLDLYHAWNDDGLMGMAGGGASTLGGPTVLYAPEDTPRVVAVDQPKLPGVMSAAGRAAHQAVMDAYWTPERRAARSALYKQRHPSSHAARAATTRRSVPTLEETREQRNARMRRYRARLAATRAAHAQRRRDAA